MNNPSIINSYLYIERRSFQLMSNFPHLEGVFIKEKSPLLVIPHSMAIFTKKYTINVSSLNIWTTNLYPTHIYT